MALMTEMAEDPARFGFDPERLARIGHWMERNAARRHFTGASVLVARHGEIVYLSTLGTRCAERDLPFARDTIVRIYSMTKPVTSVALMMLVEQGLLHLDTPVSEFLPVFADCCALIDGATSVDQTVEAPAPTIHQLLIHTSGMAYAFNENVLAEAYTRNNIHFDPNSGGLDAAVDRLARMPLAFQPGTRWEYSVSTDVIGRVVEVVSGQPLDRFFATEIFEPLGMSETGFAVRPDQINRFADCYTERDDHSLALTDRIQNSAFLQDAVTTLSGGGGLVSTLDDYLRFAEFLRLGAPCRGGHRLLSPRTLAFMRSNHLPSDIASMEAAGPSSISMDGIGFGIGGAVVLDPARSCMAGSEGDFYWGGMASTIFWIDPKEALTCIYFTQVIPSAGYPLRAELKALVHGALTD